MTTEFTKTELQSIMTDMSAAITSASPLLMEITGLSALQTISVIMTCPSGFVSYLSDDIYLASCPGNDLMQTTCLKKWAVCGYILIIKNFSPPSFFITNIQ